jgi:hypothetical protein
MKVVGYSYDAALHCPDCTKKYAFTIQAMTEDFWTLFENGDAAIIDSEHNELHAIFSTDEAGDTPDHCDDCGAFIDTSWHSSTMEYAEDAMRDYIKSYFQNRDSDRNAETLDIWNENMDWCLGRDEKLRSIYNKIREREQNVQ